jgi:hypothetical protein
MKPITAIAALVLASLAAVGSAYAQDHAARATVPFGFFVGDKWIPAGTYTMTSDTRSPDIIAIRDANSTVSLLKMGLLNDQKPGSNTLLFKKYGDKYFLHAISCARCRMNVGFPDSKRERQARTQEASLAPPTDVYLALK